MLVAEGVHVEAISPQPVRMRGGRTIVDLGDLVSEQVLDVVLRLTFPFGDVGRTTGAVITGTTRAPGTCSRRRPSESARTRAATRGCGGS